MSNEPDVAALLVDVRREIALGKLNELGWQALRLGEYVREGLLSPSLVADTLHEAAVSNGLVLTHGEEIIQDVIAVAFDGSIANAAQGMAS